MLVFVTVGTTSFDALVEVVTSKPIKGALERRGYKKLVVQYGRGKVEVKNVVSPSFTVEAYRFKESLADDIREASLVISHAGAGTCLEVLEAKKPLVVVVNETLMNNHQFELARQLHKDGHLLYCTCSSLLETLQDMDLSTLKPLPPPRTSVLVEQLSARYGLTSS